MNMVVKKLFILAGLGLLNITLGYALVNMNNIQYQFWVLSKFAIGHKNAPFQSRHGHVQSVFPTTTSHVVRAYTQRRNRYQCSMTSKNGMDVEGNSITSSDVYERYTKSLRNFALYLTVAILYWYLMVFGAAAQANGLPVPDFLPMTPGWPATDADFQPVLEDSYHFFYLSELLHSTDAPYVIPPRLAIFNFVEAWIFCFLPVLWKDSQRRLPRPVLLGSWFILGINLTNAFLAPYLAITEFRINYKSNNQNMKDDSSIMTTMEVPKNQFLSTIFGGVTTAVVTYAVWQCLTVATVEDWSEFWKLVQTDRSYLAFCVDPILMAVFQPLVLARVSPQGSPLKPLDYVPFVGMVYWLLFRGEEEED